MLPASQNFRDAERADVNQVAVQAYLVLGDYASAPAYGSTATASGEDGSGDYPATGAIDGDRTEINIGPASGADDDVGKSSWRSAVAPVTTPQTLTVNFGTSRTISRVKLYHLSSHGLSSYKLETSPDNSTWTLADKTTDQGGAITTTHEVDTVDFPEVSCQYVKLTVSDTVVASDKANVVAIECYRLVDISSRLTGVNINRTRDYKLTNPLASTCSLSVDNSDKFFSFSHISTAAELASGFVNSDLRPGIGVIVKCGYAYGGGTPETVSVFNGSVDRISVNPADRSAQIECRDQMKGLINQILSSKLKTAVDIKAAMQYALNLCNVSDFDMDIDTTGVVIDYFYIANQSVFTTIQQLVQAAADAQFYFDESGKAIFRDYSGTTPLNHVDTTETDFEAGTVLTNIDTVSQPGRIGRKWFLIDNFNDGNFSANPAWSNRQTVQSHTDTDKTDWDAGIKTNLDTDLVSGQVRRRWFLIDNFNDSDLSHNPAWTRSLNPSKFSTVFDTGDFRLQYQGTFSTPATMYTTDISPNMAKTGSWSWQTKFDTLANAYQYFGFLSSSAFNTEYGITSNGLGVTLYHLEGGTFLPISYNTINNVGNLLDGSFHRFHVSVSTTDNYTYTFMVYVDGTLIITGTDNIPDGLSPTLISLHCVTNVGGTFSLLFDNFFYSFLPMAYEVPTNTTAIFESAPINQSTDTYSEGTFTVAASTPVGTSIQAYTATSDDNVTYDSYIQVVDGLIRSTPRAWIKYLLILSQGDNESPNGGNLLTPVVDSVTLTWTTVGWRCLAPVTPGQYVMAYYPGTSNVTAGIDIPFSSPTGSWRTNITMTPGTGGGQRFRMYFLTSGYDIPTNTYLNGYYVEIDQAAGKIRLYKIDSSASRTLLNEVVQAINTSQHSLRATRTNTDILNVYWDEVSVINLIDSSYTGTSALAFEVSPNGDLNGNSAVDNIYYSPQVDGTGSIVDTLSVYESEVIDMSASVSSLGIFSAGTVLPAGTSISFATATSSDGLTFDPYVSVTVGQSILSAVKRYIKYRTVLSCPIDSGLNNANLTTPYVTDVTINWSIGVGSTKYPTSISYVIKYDDILLGVSQEIADNLGGDSSIINDVTVLAQPQVLVGDGTATQWQGTVQTPPVPISVTDPLSVLSGQVLTYGVSVPGMDTSQMSGADPAAAVVTFASGATGTWRFSRIHPTKPILEITITGNGNITDLRIIGKTFSASDSVGTASSSNAASIRQYGDRQVSISNPYIVNSSIAGVVAAKLVSNYKDPTSYIPQAVVRPIFGVQLGDRITLVESNTDINGDYIIVGVSHQVSTDVSSAQASTTLLLKRIV